MSKVYARSDGVELEILYPPYCKVCGSPIPDSFAEYNPYCSICNSSPDKYNPLVRIRAFGKYLFESEYPDDRLSDEIRRMKTDQTVIPLLQECLYYSMEHQYPELQKLDVVIPVMRGSGDSNYNPSAILAQGIAKRYNITYYDVLSAKEYYRPMHQIDGLEQKEMEIAGKIGCDQHFDGESILLIDDTCINGVTKRECTRVLKAHGAGEVWSLVLGRKVDRQHLEVLRSYNGR